MVGNRRVRGFGRRAGRGLAAVFLACCATTGFAQMPGQKLPGLPEITVEQTGHGLRAHVGQEVVDVTVCGDSVDPRGGLAGGAGSGASEAVDAGREGGLPRCGIHVCAKPGVSHHQHSGS